MRVAFIGAVEFSQRALEKLISMGTRIVGVCTLQASPGNADHRDLTPLCLSSGIPSRYTPDINGEPTVQWLRSLQPDVIFCFGWSRLIRTELLELAPHGIIGYHPAALPQNRGRHPLIWALALGLEQTASTFFVMDEGADSGDSVDQVPVQIDSHDDAGSLYRKVTDVALEQIERFVPLLAAGALHPLPQDDGVSNAWRKRTRADGVIDWRMSAEGIRNLVRALARPYVGAEFSYRGETIKVWRSMAVEAPANAEPGKVISSDCAGVVVKCGQGGLRIIESEPEFKPAAGEYL